MFIYTYKHCINDSNASFVHRIFTNVLPQQNRDRLELYALHRQAVSGDAPSINVNTGNNGTTGSTTMNATDRAKYNAWKSKLGMSTSSAMQQYIQEADRQVRVYGTAPSSTAASKHLQDSIPNGSATGSSAGTQPPAPHSHPPAPTSRGLAAIPLLCAAASEQRVSYLRRIQTTPYHNAWWKRQEPLLAPPGTIFALPEHVLLIIATGVETISLFVTYRHGINEAASSSATSNAQNGSGTTLTSSNANTNPTNGGQNKHNHNSNTSTTSNTLIPHAVGVTVQSALWPLHNVLLSTWMTVILIYMIASTSLQCTSTILLGSRRTGRSLHTIYCEQILFISQSIYTIMESHQPVSVRCIGLLFLPYTFVLRVLRTIHPTLATTASTLPDAASSSSSSSSNSMLLVTCSVYSVLVTMTLWYWLWVIPCIVILGMDYICSILILGPCFGIIELASQL